MPNQAWSSSVTGGNQGNVGGCSDTLVASVQSEQNKVKFRLMGKARSFPVLLFSFHRQVQLQFIGSLAELRC